MNDNGRDFEAAFTRIYDEHASAVYRHCYYRMLDQQTAEDVMQEAFIRLWTYLAGGKSVENPRAFLYTTANRLIIDMARQRKRRPLMSVEKLTEIGREPGESSVEESIIHRESQQKLHDILASLKQPYRDLLIMRHLDGFSVAEIARITGRSAPVVSVQLHRAMRALRSLLNHAND